MARSNRKPDPVPPVDEESEVPFTNWALVHHSSVGYRLAGYREDSGRGRMTSMVAAVNLSAMTATTESGRIYHFRGDQDPDAALLVVKAYMARWGIGVRDMALADVEKLEQGLRPAMGVNKTMPTLN
jgi:hypothetical protein